MVKIEGGIISRQSGSNVTFKLKCNKCGYEDHSEHAVNVQKGITEVTTKRCTICGNKQVIKMKHSQ